MFFWNTRYIAFGGWLSDRNNFLSQVICSNITSNESTHMFKRTHQSNVISTSSNDMIFRQIFATNIGANFIQNQWNITNFTKINVEYFVIPRTNREMMNICPIAYMWVRFTERQAHQIFVEYSVFAKYHVLARPGFTREQLDNQM